MTELDIILPAERLRLLRQGALVVTSEPAVFRIEGPGALQCLQGLLTNDLAKPGEQSLVYGAFLTPKGMIVADCWVLRHADGFLLVAPPQGCDATRELLARSLPPRLARWQNLSGEYRAAWLLGAHGFATLARSGLAPLPEACGRVTALELPEGGSHAASQTGGSGGAVLALAPEQAGFAALALGPAAAIDVVVARAHAAGAVAGDQRDRDAARILAGWPALGAEIDAKTLPQEVRYDEIGGVSYTKGCYTGQETVARVHFRGHTNRELRGLAWGVAWDGGPDGSPEARTIVHGERDVGTVRSTLTAGGRTIGLAPLRREVAVGATVLAGGREATVMALPFEPEALPA